MSRYFDANDPGGFSAYSLSHLMALFTLVVVAALLYAARRWLREGARSARGRLTLAAVLVLSELALNVWYAAEGVFSLKETLPLELCSISLYLCAAMLVWRSDALFQIVYFTGIGGALQALLTPVLWYGFPHFRFVHFFAAHIAIIIAVLYMVWVEGFRPKLRSVFTTLGFLNVLLVFVLLINRATGGNYMFVSRKPETASLLDLLGPYPWYLLSMEAAALVLFLLLYAPFAFRSPRRRRKAN